jgi:hypothetical protein
MPKPEAKLKEAMPPLSDAENARRDAEARRALEAREGISADELRAWLHARIDGKNLPMPKARKF